MIPPATMTEGGRGRHTVFIIVCSKHVLLFVSMSPKKYIKIIFVYPLKAISHLLALLKFGSNYVGARGGFCLNSKRLMLA
jgi:hypothetical protein